MKNLLLRSSITLVSALAIANTAFAADFVVPVDMKNVGSGWTDASVLCAVSGPALAQKSGYAKAPLVNGAFKGNVTVTVVLTAAEVPLAKTWYCALNVASANGGPERPCTPRLRGRRPRGERQCRSRECPGRAD